MKERETIINKLVKFLKENNLNIQMFNTRNITGDDMETVYDKDGITVDYCAYYEYIEVLGLTQKEFNELEINLTK